MKYHIITFGCQMNESDSERIAALLKNMGYQKAPTKKGADLIVFNACSVRQSAIDRVYGQIKNIKSYKPRPITILTGCLLKQDLKKLGEKFDYVLSIKALPSWKKYLKQKPPFSYYPDPRSSLALRKLKIRYLKMPAKSKSGFCGLVPISTGCNNFCTYCVVPFTRGPEISRPAEDVLKEIRLLVKNKTKEIWLLGQNVNSYKDKDINFAKLLKRIDKIKGDFWIRFTSSHPKDFSDGLIAAISKSKKITPYINLPVQSGDNLILKKMNRPYTVSGYKKLVKKIREKVPNVSLSTDAIVGFPGETKKQFENTKKLFKKMEFDMAYISQYSPRLGTAASKMEDNVPKEEKRKRWKELTEILKKTALANNKKQIGKILEVLVETEKDGFCIGKSRNYKTVRFKSEKDIIGKIRRVKITDATAWGLKGEQFKKLIVILGPTSSGKTALSVELAKKFHSEIVSADSRQVYKGMDIGSGKITRKEMQGIAHHLLDVVSPRTRFSVANYQEHALEAINKIYKKGKLPLLVGGSAFYIYSLINKSQIPTVKPDWKLRAKLEQLSEDQLFRKLKKLDPKRAENIDQKNKRRLVRAIEIVEKTKKPVPSPVSVDPRFDTLKIGIKRSSKDLKTRIKKRLKMRLARGMIAEVKKLKSLGLSWKHLESFGLEYRHIALLLQGKIKRDEMINNIEKDSLNLVKHQMTWFKRDKQILWISTKEQAETLIKDFLKE